MSAFEAKIARELLENRGLRRSLRIIVQDPPPGRLTREALIEQIRLRRDAWEGLTRRCQDLPTAPRSTLRAPPRVRTSSALFSSERLSGGRRGRCRTEAADQAREVVRGCR